MFLIFSSFFTWGQSTCQETGTSTGTDSSGTNVSISSFSCTAGGTITSMSLTTTNTASYCNNWYSYNISVTHSGGVVSTTGNCNVTLLDLSSFNGIAIDVGTITNVTVTANDDDVYSDTVTVNVQLDIVYTPPACSSPNLSATTSITDVSADISWSAPTSAPADGYEYLLTTDATLVPDATTVPTGSVAAGVLTKSFTGFLSPNTTYYYFIRSVCSSSDVSSWTGSSFTTDCAAFSAPYSESFDGITSNIPLCWDKEGTVTTASYNWNSFSTGFSGRGLRFDSYFASSGQIGELITPNISLTGLSTAELKFQFKNPTGGNFEVLISTDGGTNYTSLETNLTGQSSWVEKAYVLTSYIGSNVKFKFKATSNYGSGDAYVYLDEISVAQIPTCLTPSALLSSNITSTTADIAWTASTSAPTNGYEYYYSTDATAPTTSTVASGSVAIGETASLTGLNSNTTYYYWVRSVCSSSDKSAWMAGTAFTTDCGSNDIGYTENFNSFVPTCWAKAENGDLATGPAVFGTGSWTADGFGNVGSSGSARFNIYSTGDNDWLISPMFSVPASGLSQVKFSAIMTNYSGTALTGALSGDDKLEVLIKSSTQTAWSVLYTVNAANPLTATAEVFNFDVSTFAGESIQIAFRAVEDATSGGDINVYIDDFMFVEVPVLDNFTLQYPGDAEITTCDDFTVLAQAYEAGLTNMAGQGAGVEVWVGYSTTNNDPSTWTDWTMAAYDMDASVNDQYTATLTGLTAGTYYYSTRFKLEDGPYTYGGYSNSGGGAWNGTTNVNGMLTIEEILAPTGSVAQEFCGAATLADIVVDGDNIKWYDAASAGNELMMTDIVVSGTTYYATQTVSGCESSSAIAVTATVNVTPAPTIGAPTTTYCYGVTFEDLDATGNDIQWYNGPIGGTAINSSDLVTDGIYYASQTIDGCPSARISMEVFVNNEVLAPLGNASQAFCAGAKVSNLDVIGTNLVWYDAATGGNALPLSTLLVDGAMYYASQTENNCDSSSRLAVTATVTTTAAPSGDAVQIFTVADLADASVADLVAVGTDVVWYATQGEAEAGVNPLSATDVIENGMTYYATQLVDGCESALPLAVTVTVQLSGSSFDVTGLRYYPNPVQNQLTIDYTSEITSVEVFNMLGQKVLSVSPNATSASIDMSQLTAGNYMVNMTVDGQTKTVRVIKK